MSADWRRTPPATRTMFWATSPPPSASSIKLSTMTSGSGSVQKTAVASSALVDGESIMKKRSLDFTGVSVTVERAHGVNGRLSINESEIRWSGQKADSSSARFVLGEIKDLGNKEDRPNWTVSCSLAMVKHVSELAENDQTLRVTVEDSSTYEFSFRSTGEANMARLRLLAALNSSEGQNENFVVSASAFDYERRRSRENTSRRPRRSISFEPILPEGDEESEEEIVADENALPQNVAIKHAENSFPQRKVKAEESKSSPATVLGDNFQHSVQALSASESLESVPEDIDSLRKWARIYSSKVSSTDEIAAAAINISKTFNYPLNMQPNRPVRPVRRTLEEQKLLEREYYGRIFPTLKNMKEASDQQRARVEMETEVTIQSPKGRERRFFRYICNVTGNPVSPGTFEKRYRERILGWSPTSEIVEERAMVMDSLHPTDNVEETASTVESSNAARNDQELAKAERIEDDLDHPLQVTASNIEGMDIVEVPETQLADDAQPRDHQLEDLATTTLSAAEQFAEALRIEEEELHLAFDRALEQYRSRRQELERMYGI